MRASARRSSAAWRSWPTPWCAEDSMYEQFFNLRERAFDLTPNPKFLVLTESHSEVLSNLEYGIASRKGITVLVGDAGSGKTTLIRTAIQRQPARVHTV